MEIQLFHFFSYLCNNFPFFFSLEQNLTNEKKNGNVEKYHGKITIPNEYAIYCAHKFVDVSCCYKYIEHIQKISNTYTSTSHNDSLYALLSLLSSSSSFEFDFSFYSSCMLLFCLVLLLFIVWR